MSNDKSIDNHSIQSKKADKANSRSSSTVQIKGTIKPLKTTQIKKQHLSNITGNQEIAETQSSITIPELLIESDNTKISPTPIADSYTNQETDSIDTPSESRSSLKEKQLSTRKNRRDRQEKRKRELLESAINKLKAHSTGNENAFKNLEKSISDNFLEDTRHPHIETSVSEKDILDTAEANKKTQLTPLKTQNAKDRFKNALKGILAPEKKEPEILDEKLQDPKSLMLKKKLEERKRIKKMISQYLEDMGLTYRNNNFQSLSNQLTDILLLNIDTTLPKYKSQVAHLKKRAELSVRSGRDERTIKEKKSKTEAIVGDLFSNYPISKNNKNNFSNQYIMLKQLKIPNGNFDTLREDLLKHLLFDDQSQRNTPYKEFDFSEYDAMYDHSDIAAVDSIQNPIESVVKPKTPTESIPPKKRITKEGLLALARQKKMTLEKNMHGNFVIKPKEIVLNTKLRDLIQKPFVNASDNTQHIHELKSKLQKLISRNV
jgi:hypothetical protein